MYALREPACGMRNHGIIDDYNRLYDISKITQTYFSDIRLNPQESFFYRPVSFEHAAFLVIPNNV